MFKETNYLIKCIVTLTAAIISLTLAACSMERSAEETVLYDQTVTQSYPKDNILALTSVRSDTGEQGNRFIIEFDTSSEYVWKEGLESALKMMEEMPTSSAWGFVGESAAQVKALEVQVTEKKNSLYITLLFAPQVECDHVKIKLGGRSGYLDGPWEAPSLQVIDFNYVQDGAEGILFRTQEYDDKEQQWKECHDSFHENYEPYEIEDGLCEIKGAGSAKNRMELE